MFECGRTVVREKQSNIMNVIILCNQKAQVFAKHSHRHGPFAAVLSGVGGKVCRGYSENALQQGLDAGKTITVGRIRVFAAPLASDNINLQHQWRT